MSQSNFWVGKEVEGRLKGLQTLFIVGDQPVDTILEKLYKCLKEHLVISQLYFGAGNQSKVTNYNTIQYFLKKGYFITYEIMLDELNYVPVDILSDCHIIACEKNKIDCLKPTDTIKFETSDLIYCTTKEQFSKTSFDEYHDTKI